MEANENIVAQIVKENEAKYGKILPCCDYHESFCRCITGEPRLVFQKEYWFGTPGNAKLPGISPMTVGDEATLDYFKTALHESERRMTFLIPVKGIKSKPLWKKLMFWKK